MEDLKKALEFVTDLAKAAERPNITEIGNRAYSDKELKAVRDPRPETITVTTLLGFLNLLEARVEKFDPNSAVIHVVDQATVELKSTVSDKWGHRQTFAAAELPGVSGFNFGHYCDTESMVIALHTHFVANEDINYVLRLASTVEAVRSSKEDGTAQTVALRAGPARADVVELRTTLRLAPFRTFSDLDQPLSDFFLHVKQEGKNPTLALFEADGGRWKIEAMASIREFLFTGLAKRSGFQNIPIVS